MILAYLRLIAHCVWRWHRPEYYRVCVGPKVVIRRMNCSCGKIFLEWDAWDD